MQPCIRNAGVPLHPWKSGSTELFLLQPCRICLLFCLCPAHVSPGKFLIARVSKGHHKSLSGFISPPRRRALVLLAPTQGFSYLRGGAIRFLSSLFTEVFASPAFCRYMEG